MILYELLSNDTSKYLQHLDNSLQGEGELAEEIGPSNSNNTLIAIELSVFDENAPSRVLTLEEEKLQEERQQAWRARVDATFDKLEQEPGFEEEYRRERRKLINRDVARLNKRRETLNAAFQNTRCIAKSRLAKRPTQRSRKSRSQPAKSGSSSKSSSESSGSSDGPPRSKKADASLYWRVAL